MPPHTELSARNINSIETVAFALWAALSRDGFVHPDHAEWPEGDEGRHAPPPFVAATSQALGNLIGCLLYNLADDITARRNQGRTPIGELAFSDRTRNGVHSLGIESAEGLSAWSACQLRHAGLSADDVQEVRQALADRGLLLQDAPPPDEDREIDPDPDERPDPPPIGWDHPSVKLQNTALGKLVKAGFAHPGAVAEFTESQLRRSTGLNANEIASLRRCLKEFCITLRK